MIFIFGSSNSTTEMVAVVIHQQLHLRYPEDLVHVVQFQNEKLVHILIDNTNRFATLITILSHFLMLGKKSVQLLVRGKRVIINHKYLYHFKDRKT